jgi:hypothetical protein
MPFDGLRSTELLDDLRAAKAFVQRGWCQGSCFAPHVGGGCLFASVRDVTHGWDGNPRYHRLHDFVLAHLPDRTLSLSHWNDTPGRTQGEVIALIDECLEDVS